MQLLTKFSKRKLISMPRQSDIKTITQKYNEPAKLFCNGKWIRAACLRCQFPHCIKLLDQDINCESFPEFSYSKIYNVCPVGAITWNFKKELPEINPHICIKCGLCASLCPVGAIYSTHGKIQIALPTEDYLNLPLNEIN